MTIGFGAACGTCLGAGADIGSGAGVGGGARGSGWAGAGGEAASAVEASAYPDGAVAAWRSEREQAANSISGATDNHLRILFVSSRWSMHDPCHFVCSYSIAAGCGNGIKTSIWLWREALCKMVVWDAYLPF